MIGYLAAISVGVIVGLTAFLVAAAVKSLGLERPIWKAAALAASLCAAPVFAAGLVQAFHGRMEAAVIGGQASTAEVQSALIGFSVLGLTLLTVGIQRQVKQESPRYSRKELNQRLLDGVSDAVVVVDPELRIIDWNPAMERISGWSRRTAAGRLLTECPGFEDGAPHLDFLRLALQGVETATPKDQAKPQPTQHGVAECRGYYSPLRSKKGELSGAFAILTPEQRAA